VEWNPNRLDAKPIYKQIVEYIEFRISNGEYLPGSLLPSERSLANELKVNRSTVVRAYDELRASGVIISKKGSGTRISQLAIEKPDTRVPNWSQYVLGGSLLPNMPLIRRIHKETQNKHLIDLATGELSPDLFPKEQFDQLLQEAAFNFHLGYENSQGNFHLRSTIAQHVQQYKNIASTPSSVLITAGSQQALHLIVLCLLKQGDAVAIEDPSYCYSLPIFRSAGLKIHLLNVDKDGVNPEEILELHRKHNLRMIFLNPNFQNPTGVILAEERQKKILDIATKCGIPIVEDDPYSLTVFEGKPVTTLKSMDHSGNVIYISSLSKIISSGLRIGWVIAPDEVMNRLSDAKQQIDFGQSIFPQWIANEFLNSSYFPIHLAKIKLELKKRRDLLVASLNRYLSDQVNFLIPEGGIHLWCKLAAPINEVELLESSIKNGVIYTPGSSLGTKKGFIRFTFGRANEDQIREGILKFSRAMDELL
jgi:GntR family transcriptional regulator, regulator for abcA and norABC